MQSYLTGRDADKSSNEDSIPSFRPFLSVDSEQNSQNKPEQNDSADHNPSSEVIFEEADCPKVEVLSEDGVPQKIVIHLQDGRLLEIACKY